MFDLGLYINAFAGYSASVTTNAKIRILVDDLRVFFPCAMAARIAQQSPYIFAFNMYGHPFWESFVGHSGEKCDLTLIVYPWFCRRFRTVFDRC